MVDYELERIVYHEAGHVVAHFALDRGMEYVTILPGAYNLGHVKATGHSVRFDGSLENDEQGELWKREVAILLAGPVAERRLMDGEVVNLEEDDREQVLEFVSRFGEAIYHEQLTRAEAIVQNDWSAVEAIAAGLLKNKRLSSDEARAIWVANEGVVRGDAIRDQICKCGSGEWAKDRIDALGAYLMRACDKCWPEKRKPFRDRVLDEYTQDEG